MITTIVEFALPEPVTTAQAKEIFLSTSPKYLGMTGLLRKYYFLSEDGSKAGGIYLWHSRLDAERVYTAEWKAFVRNKYGSDPSITFLETPVVVTPVVVDNVADAIIADS